jgi:hypothetical protein
MMRIFNLKGWLINLGGLQSWDNKSKNTKIDFHYLLFTDKPCYENSINFLRLNHKDGICIRSGWADMNEAIYFELTEEENKELGLPITEKYYYLAEDNELNYKEKDRYIKKGERPPLPPYGILTIDNNKIKWKPLKQGKNIRYLTRNIIEDKIEKIFQKYCFGHKENWILPRDYPDIIEDVKEELYYYMEGKDWLRKSYKFK